MKQNNILFLTLLFLVSLPFTSLPAQQLASNAQNGSIWSSNYVTPLLPADQYAINFSISHGHCQLPMEARFTNVNARYTKPDREDLRVDFEVSTNTLIAGRQVDDEWTKKMHSAPSFDVKRYPTMRFECKNSYRLGDNWYQINGTLTIKGKSLPATFRARPQLNHKSGCGQTLVKVVMDGQVNLKDYGIHEGNVGGADDKDRTMFINMDVMANGC